MGNCDRAALLIFLAVKVEFTSKRPTGPSTKLVHRQVLVLFLIGVFGPPKGSDNLVDRATSLTLRTWNIVAK